MAISRRHFVAGGLCGCCAWSAMPSRAEVLPMNIQPLVGENYSPVDVDERGLWQACGKLEADLAESDLVLLAPDLEAYTAEILRRLLGRPAAELRVHIVHEPTFNASMAPNGMMMIHTGFLVRVHNEAQCAAVLGHEAGHYFRKHTVENWRNRGTKSAIAAFVGAGANAAAGYTAMRGYDGQSWIDLANAINNALVMSMFRFSRAQESEADAYGIGLMARAGYTPRSASEVWRQLIDERMASAESRDKKYKDDSLSAFSTHPPTEERMADLAETAIALERDVVVQSATDGRAQWVRMIAPYFPGLLEEQVKLNDPGASLYLIESHAREGWNGVLRFHEGETYRLRDASGDLVKSAQAYAAAIKFADAPPEAWRAHGYALLKTGRTDEGRQALTQYLELKPNAKDAGMVRFSLAN